MLGRNSLIMSEKQFLSKSIRNPILNRASAENSNGVVVEDCEMGEGKKKQDKKTKTKEEKELLHSEESKSAS